MGSINFTLKNKNVSPFIQIPSCKHLLPDIQQFVLSVDSKIVS